SRWRSSTGGTTSPTRAPTSARPCCARRRPTPHPRRRSAAGASASRPARPPRRRTPPSSIRPERSSLVRAYVAFGANLGDPAAAFFEAVQRLDALPGTRVVARSSLYRSAPVGVAGQPDYLNAVIALDTALAPRPLLEALLAIEHDSGRR